MTIIFLTLALTLGTVGALPPYIGQSFYVANLDVLGDDIRGGSDILVNIPADCFDCVNSSAVDDQTFDYYESTKTFYRSVAQTYSLGTQLQEDFTLGVTLDVTTGQISGSNRTVKGMTLDIKAKKGLCKIRSQCLHNETMNIFTRDFIADFEALPRHIRKYKDSGGDKLIYGYDFTRYDRFLNEYGSHIMSGAIYGARMYQHCFSKVEKDYSYRDYQVKTCVAFTGTANITKTNVTACAGISQEEASSSSSMETSARLILRGGTAETRAQLMVERTNELIAKFLTELDSDEPIEYSFTALWTLLGEKYYGTEHFAKVRHLEGYYLGKKNFQCPGDMPDTKYVEGGADEVVGSMPPQWFTETDSSTDDYPSYQCVIPYQDCHVDDDCDYLPFWCQCSGDTCYKNEFKTTNTGEQREYVRSVNDEKWGWHGCQYMGVNYCVCRSGSRYKVNPIWEQDTDGGDFGQMHFHLHDKFFSGNKSAKSKGQRACSGKEEL